MTTNTREGWTSMQYEKGRKAIKKLPVRVRVLLAAEWALSQLPIYEAVYKNDPRPRDAVETTFMYGITGMRNENTIFAIESACTKATERASKDGNDALDEASADPVYAAECAAAAAGYAVAVVAYPAHDGYNIIDVLYTADAAHAAGADWVWIMTTYKDAIGPKGAKFQPEWGTTTAVTLAREIVNTRNFTLMPILADAIQDAGCDNVELIEHLQSKEPFTTADWVLWNLLELDA